MNRFMIISSAMAMGLGGLVFDAHGQSRMRDNHQDHQERPVSPTMPRPAGPSSDNQVDAQASTDGRIDVLWNRVMVMGCSGTSTRNITMRLACPDGSSIEVDMRCTSTSSGAWPNCHVEENCTQTNTASCPPAEKEPED